MTIRLTRTSHSRPSRSFGLEIDDDGFATGYQTSGHRVGRFARELTARERKALDRGLSAVKESDSDPADHPGAARKPGGSTEQLVADGLPDVRFDANDTPPKPFTSLLKRLIALREDLIASPLAAIELEVTGSPYSVRLQHVGTEPVPVRLGPLTLRATLFDKDSAIVDRASNTVDATGTESPVGPGWVLELTDDLGLAPPQKGGFLTVNLGTPEIDSLGDGVLRPAEFSWMAE